MTTQEHWHDLVVAFGHLHKVDGLVPDEDGYVAIDFDDGLLLRLQFNRITSLITAFAVLGRLPETGAEGQMRHLLAGNLFWQGTGGGTIGVDPDDGQIIFARQFPLHGLEVADFETLVDQFVRLTQFWRDLLNKDADTAEPADTKPTSGRFMIRG